MRYYFDVFDGESWTQDDIGIDCRDREAARYQGVLALTEFARELLPGDGDHKKLRVRIRQPKEAAFLLELDFDTIPSLDPGAGSPRTGQAAERR